MMTFAQPALICLLLTGLSEMSPVEERQIQDDPCNCGVSQAGSTRIIGGQLSTQGLVPWRVSTLTLPNGATSGAGCGGTIISKNWVLTAAHCVDGIPKGSESTWTVHISAGSNTQLDRSKGQYFKVSGAMVRKHPNYDSQAIVNDIALIEIPGSGFNFNVPKISRACLPYKLRNTVLENKQVLASGWGQTNQFANSTSPQLRDVILNLFEYTQCNRLLQQSRISNRLNQNQCCTKTPNKDICQGDSGGSIDYFDGRYYAFGINSYVIGSCANPKGASVMTKISQYLTWIEEITKTASYCKS